MSLFAERRLNSNPTGSLLLTFKMYHDWLSFCISMPEGDPSQGLAEIISLHIPDASTGLHINVLILWFGILLTGIVLVRLGCSI